MIETVAVVLKVSTKVISFLFLPTFWDGFDSLHFRSEEAEAQKDEELAQSPSE